MPNLLPDWAPWIRPAGRLIWFSLVFMVGIVATIAVMRRPKSEEPSTWAQCMAGAVFVLGMMGLAYAILPHEFITFSDRYLQWDTSKFLVQTYAVKIDYQALRDIIVGGIYVTFVVINIALFALWQKRTTVAERAAKAEESGDAPTTRRSRFGRPLRTAN
jgi:fucose 4-O-acetylase-like acetyltransferase